MLAKILAGAPPPSGGRAIPLSRAFHYGTPAALLILAALFIPLWKGDSGRSGMGATASPLDLGFWASESGQDPLETFRARHAGRFREFRPEGPPDPAWVSFPVEFPSELPEGMELQSVMIFSPDFCDSLGLIFSDGERTLWLLQQPVGQPVSFSGLTTVNERVRRHRAASCAVGPYNLMTWTEAGKRTILLSNLTRSEVEATVAAMRYVH